MVPRAPPQVPPQADAHSHQAGDNGVPRIGRWAWEGVGERPKAEGMSVHALDDSRRILRTYRLGQLQPRGVSEDVRQAPGDLLDRHEARPAGDPQDEPVLNEQPAHPPRGDDRHQTDGGELGQFLDDAGDHDLRGRLAHRNSRCGGDLEGEPSNGPGPRHGQGEEARGHAPGDGLAPRQPEADRHDPEAADPGTQHRPGHWRHGQRHRHDQQAHPGQHHPDPHQDAEGPELQKEAAQALPPLQAHRRPVQVQRGCGRTISGRRRRSGRRRLGRGDRRGPRGLHWPRRRRHRGPCPRHRLRRSRRRHWCGHQPVLPRRGRGCRRGRWCSAGRNTSRRRHPTVAGRRRRPGRVAGMGATGARHDPV